MSASASEAASDYSKGPIPHDRVSESASAWVARLAVAGGLLLVWAEFSPVYEVVVSPLIAGAPPVLRRSVDGAANHGHALLVVALAAVALALVVARGVRAAALALLVLGGVALLVALIVDLPDASGSGRLPESVTFQDARTQPGYGLYLELAGGALLALAGALGLVSGRSSRPPRRAASGPPAT